MRRLLGPALALGLLFALAPTPRAHAQIGFSSGVPGYGVGISSVGLGYPGYRYANSFTGYYGGYGLGGFLPGASYYNSGYSSFYTAPGTTSFISGRVSPYVGVGYPGYGLGYPGYGVGYGGYGGYPGYYGTTYAPSFGGNSRWISTGMFMGLPRPGGGLVRVPY